MFDENDLNQSTREKLHTLATTWRERRYPRHWTVTIDRYNRSELQELCDHGIFEGFTGGRQVQLTPLGRIEFRHILRELYGEDEQEERAD